MSIFLTVLFVLIVVWVVISVRAKEVKGEMVDEALERGDTEEAEEIEDMSIDELINNYNYRF